MDIYVYGFKAKYAYYRIDSKFNEIQKVIGYKEILDTDEKAEMYAIMRSISENFDKCKLMRFIHRGNRLRSLIKGKVRPKNSFEDVFISFVKSYKDSLIIHFSNAYNYEDKEEYVKVKNEIEKDVVKYIPISRGDTL